MVEKGAASATPIYNRWPLYASFGHSMPQSSASDSPPLVPHHNPSIPASMSGHEHPSLLPTLTIDPNVLRRPIHPILQVQDSLSAVRDYVRFSDWLARHMEETKVGDPGVPACASQLADDACSIFMCFIVKIKRQGAMKYKCVDCGHTVKRVDRALEHQRFKRGHQPFRCPEGW